MIKKILIVEDNMLVNMAVNDILKEAGYETFACDTGKEASKILKKEEINLIILDMMLPDTLGTKLIDSWQKAYPKTVIIMITAHGDIPTAVECLRKGAYDFLTKPVDKKLMLSTIKNALKHQKLLSNLNTSDLQQNKKNSKNNEPSSVNIISSAPKMAKIMQFMQLISNSDFSSVLLEGESGTGKGLLARTLHSMSNRKDKPFVEVNCSALPPTLIESELFGHKKGAFTDAKEDKIGLFEMANGGILFLDEIGDMNIDLQAKLLKIMEEQRFRPVGGDSDITVNVSIIAATNQDVQTMVEQNKFRLDLYYRLNVLPIVIPPLRDRKEDIADLCNYFIKSFNKKLNKKITGVSDEVLTTLTRYDWPGNVREFRNVIERSCILSTGKIIDDCDLLFPFNKEKVLNEVVFDAKKIPAMSLMQAEKNALKAALEECDNNKDIAAEILEITTKQLEQKMVQHALI
ncbi:sigma-54 dependent transcriptional regulator [Lentisphaerota bacterium WC36G]|nr:sigma-54 dependent transcriptional regulator [Lentisphaerae bacterium WC36]